MDLLNRVAHMDIFDLCDCLEDDSIDMILADLPYGITACEWDTIIPFEPMWEQFKRIIKPRGAIVLTASGKFTYKLVMSNFEWFKYEWIWDKGIHANFVTAQYQPLRVHEHILIFAKERTEYYPIKTRGEVNHAKRDKVGAREFLRGKLSGSLTDITGMKYPRSIIDIFRHPSQLGLHPTQKPIALFEYLIRTYTQPGETVFDPVVGSGTTALAARNTGRNYIVGDNSHEYVEIARKRLSKPYTLPMFDEQSNNEPKPVQEVLI